jgi:tRNA (guanine-N7-)-methyltransferase
MHPFWQEIFAKHQPVEVEVGSGIGTFLLPTATANPTTNFLGLERSRSRATRLAEAVRVRGLHNIVVLNADAGCIIGRVIPSDSVAAYHIYFPDPWWKRRHQRRRLFVPEFVAALARTLIAGGRLYVATDVQLVIDLVFETVSCQPAFRHDTTLRSPRIEPTTFERKGLRSGASIREAGFVKVT